MSKIVAAAVAAACIVMFTSDPSSARIKIRMSSPKPKPVATTASKPIPAANGQRGAVFVGVGVPLRPFAAARRTEPEAAPYSGPARFMAESTEQNQTERAQAEPMVEAPKPQPAAQPARPVIVSMNIPARSAADAAPAPIGKPVYCQVQTSGACKPF